jgi:hypothetical protein
MKFKCATLLLATAVAFSGASAFAHSYKQTQHHSSKSMNSMNSMNKMQGQSNGSTKGQSGGSTNQKATGSSTSGGGKY